MRILRDRVSVGVWCVWMKARLAWWGVGLGLGLGLGCRVSAGEETSQSSADGEDERKQDRRHQRREWRARWKARSAFRLGLMRLCKHVADAGWGDGMGDHRGC